MEALWPCSDNASPVLQHAVQMSSAASVWRNTPPYRHLGSNVFATLCLHSKAYLMTELCHLATNGMHPSLQPHEHVKQHTHCISMHDFD